MTVLQHISKKEMEDRTGFKSALGYSLPQEDKILVRKGLSKEKKKEVIAHEEEHIQKGEEGPFLNWLVPAAIGLFGAKKQSGAAKDATNAQIAAGNEEIAFNRESRDLARADQAPYREAGTKALDALLSLTGLGGGTPSAPAQAQPPRAISPGPNPYGSHYIPSDQNFTATGRQSSYGSDGYLDNYGRVNGGPLYNVNELGPESVYSQGGYTRSSAPRTLQSDPTGYVHPNVHGRAIGGSLGVVNPNQQIPGGSYGPKNGAADFVPQTPQVQPQENPGGVEGGYNFQTDPGYNFRFEEGQRALETSAAAKGGLLSGGFAKKALRYGQDYATNEFSNVYNRIANIAGLGQVSAQSGGNQAIQSGQILGNAAAGIGNASAYGANQQGNIWGNAAADIAQGVPWGDIFGKGGGSGSQNGTMINGQLYA